MEDKWRACETGGKSERSRGEVTAVCVKIWNSKIMVRGDFFLSKSPLVDFDRSVNLPDEQASPGVAQGAAHEAEGEAEQRHVAEIEGRLEQAIHPEEVRGEKSHEYNDKARVANSQHFKDVHETTSDCPYSNYQFSNHRLKLRKQTEFWRV